MKRGSFTTALAIWLGFCAATTLADVTIEAVSVEGAHRTNVDWLKSYIGIGSGAVVPDEVCELVRNKIMTTDVFLLAEVDLLPGTSQESKVLRIKLIEKWTLIPVIRAAFGGGTPMTVFGVYDTHSFGRLWTLGAETRRFGDAPPSYVVWARAPRWLRGRHFVNFELWRLNRVRSIYDGYDEEIGKIRSDTKLARFTFLQPVVDPRSIVASEYTLQIGADLRIQNLTGTTFTPSQESPNALSPDYIDIRSGPSTERSLMPTLLFDNVQIDGGRMDGLRLIIQNGFVFDNQSPRRKFETEIFYYKPLSNEVVLASHFLAGATALRTIHNQYFLGGFDSIRGIPDGSVVGARAAYGNLELRKRLIRLHYSQIEAAAFADAGAAGSEWSDLKHGSRNSIGFGLRTNVPQINRLMVRIDYAFATDGSGSRGINIGLNHFFQPYKPL